MPLAAPFHAPARPEAAVLAAVALLILAGAAGQLPPAAVVALAAGVSAALAGVRLSRLAVRPPTHAGQGATEPMLRPGTRAARRAWTSTRTALLLLDATVAAAGLAAAAVPLLRPASPAVAGAGPAVVATLAALGLRRLPGGPRPPARVRLRRLVDALGPAVGLVLAGWLLLPPAVLPSPARLPVTLLLGALGMAALTALTGAHRRVAAAVCRGGVALILFGLVLLATLTTGAATGWLALLAVPPLVLGMLLVSAGATRAAAPAAVERPAPLWPRVVVPAVALLLAAGRHVGSGLPPDRTTVLLALAAVPPLVLRELLRGDDRPGTGRPAGHRRHRSHASEGGPGVGGPAVDGTGAVAVRPPDRPEQAHPAPEPADPGPARSGREVAVVGPVATPTRAGLADRAALLRALATVADAPTPAGALLMVDLHIPGAGGSAPGLDEELVAEVVHRARMVVGRDDLVAGLGGAAFAVVTTAGPVLAYEVGTRLLAALIQPYQLAGSTLRVHVSIGLAEIGADGPDDVLRQADLARRRAVQLGRDRVEWYDAFLEEQLVRRLDLERELPGAVARGELDLVYQPVLGLADRSPVGTEALLRWRSPVLGTVLPAELLPVAEDLDIVGELEWWVLDRACRQLAEWSAESRQLWMAVNVTTRELTTPDFVQRTSAVLAAYGVPADRLVVEVAEPRVGPDLPTVVARLAGLRSLGVRTALDHFRAEQASLAQLRRLPIDLLKVGARLVDGAPAAPRPLIDVVVSVGDRLGVEVVAEELESPAQVDGAHRAGCRYGQGFALARPATAERVEAYFEEFPSASR
ncbi:EAL domain-containing protein [Micromonospora sp. WMMD812]|uniref:putative bifunctional diguanylate cyclase/phosphodiesterase n=1 Tax=Micromonospora sp. WMMD812 TaxID=3015152 RepID=UPI00248C0F48|nr:EAL domain-containing protein [Micromonospora sp. WMMD812]WBB70528.1 EAL domain-containing protein [Micromonospora sp. WMMD812]